MQRGKINDRERHDCVKYFISQLMLFRRRPGIEYLEFACEE